MQQASVLVLGVGNILYSDEGLGVRALRILDEQYAFPPNVRLEDGGTLGMRLMDMLMACDRLLVMDAVLCGGQPGDIYRLTGDELRKSIAFKNSMHQTDLVDTLIYCELAGKRPDAVIVGMEPLIWQTAGIELSSVIAARLPLFCERVAQEIAELAKPCLIRLNAFTLRNQRIC
jgi:hydrogenase maturation protease